MSEQLDLAFPCTREDFEAYLTQRLAREHEITRLSEELAGLTESYKLRLPMRAIGTALKVIRARKKLAEHHKEPMSYEDQARMETLVEAHLARQEEEMARLLTEARTVPDMTRGA